MSKCPYTWLRSVFSGSHKTGSEASQLRVQVSRDQQTVVDVSLPAQSARWLMELIPDDVLAKIKEEQIPIQDIQNFLAEAAKLIPCSIFTLEEPARQVKVWLE